VRAASLSGPRTVTTTGPRRRPVLTVVVCAVTVAVSVAALFSPTLMNLFTRDLSQLRAGQWWRAFTPVLVQSDGWGQLAFNLLGLAVIGAALERRVSRPWWVLVFLLGGPGSIAVLSAWKPEATSGGSSDAVAALLGAFTLLLVVDGPRMRWQWQWPAQLYAVFFAAYLTIVDLAGLVPSIIVGNVAIIVFFVARRAVRPSILSRACLVVVSVAGVLMTVAQDGHGTGILAGLAAASVVLARRWLLDRADGSRSIAQGVEVGIAVVSVLALSLLTWVAWVRLLGVDLVVTGRGNSRAEVGWASVSVVAVTSCLLAWVVLQMLLRRWPRVGARAWVGLCTIVAVASLGGPLLLAVGPTSRAALICLHLTCAASVVALLAPTKETGAGASETPQDGEPVPTATVPLVGRPLRPA
jgi:membrane associated rhomboid family serine protease